MNPHDEVRPADTSKPDPSEPFRFVCPNCERQVQGGRNPVRFYCNHCNESYHKDNLLDLNPPTI